MTETCALIVIGAPLLLFSVLGLMLLFGWAISESFTAHLTRVVILVGLGALLAIAVPMAVLQQWAGKTFLVGEIINLPESHFHLRLEFLFDSLSIPLAILTYLLCGTIAAFATNYMHRELGFQRFFLLFAMFLAGMILAVLAGSIETLFLGWELVGLSSALLVAFFHQRLGPVTNGFRVWVVYRCSDAALLLAAVLLHHAAGEGELSQLSGRAGWPNSVAILSPSVAFWAGLLFVIAACGKSALWPLSGWLPRAMEGPTPSSAVFYGALSIHLGAFLLLRISPILDQAPGLANLVVVIGIVTSIYATVVGRVQTDIKSGLAFASLVQVGLIVAEIGLGFRYLALFHILGHASLRTLQLLRAPSILRDYHELENALERQVNNRLSSWPSGSSPLATVIYRYGLERGYLDVVWELVMVRPFVRFFTGCHWLESRWLQWLDNEMPPTNESADSAQLMDEHQ
jgi:NADH:ubiquinone oxidoreductase subunit 5 (subunit L)/multisubunit Na+/H+ antiporter MnhA subunit